jgi:hypothetical protein
MTAHTFGRCSERYRVFRIGAARIELEAGEIAGACDVRGEKGRPELGSATLAVVLEVLPNQSCPNTLAILSVRRQFGPPRT